MQNAAKILILACAAIAITACSKKAPQQTDENRLMSPDANLSSGQIPPNAQIETLPPDESSEATNGELSTGDDNPDVNDLGNSH
jgi:hypothetical protein